MDHGTLVVIATIVLFYVTSSLAMYVPLDDDTDLPPQFRDVDLDTEDTAHLRKLLLKKLRFREILREQMQSPEAVLGDVDMAEDQIARHKASKRHKMDNLMDRVKAYLSQYKERQIKESMSLPSLRFGRSGINYRR
ncbi:uncharacterized protein LOC128224471 [Mya arenaria]|nr:uncharacterized protein LOC128224471 [Mya arenaria]